MQQIDHRPAPSLVDAVHDYPDITEPTVEPVPRSYPPGGYLKDGKLPQDPWGEPYHYEMPGTNNPHAYDLWSFGADGAPGGEGPDADIGNWDENAEPTG